MVARREARPQPPRIASPDLPDDLDPLSALAPHDDVTGARIGGLDGRVDAGHARLGESVLDAVSVEHLGLVDAELIDVEVDRLGAADVAARGGRWRTVRLTGGRIGTLDLADAELQDVELRGVRIDYLSLAHARVEDLLLTDCVLGTVDLPQATLARVRFEGCRADEVDTRGMTARDLDLRGLEALSYTDPTALRGATLSARQVELLAGDLARSLGIDVQD